MNFNAQSTRSDPEHDEAWLEARNGGIGFTFVLYPEGQEPDFIPQNVIEVDFKTGKFVGADGTVKRG